MSDFIYNNSIWLIPMMSIIFTIVMKIASKPSFLALSYIDWLDFGFDLSISSTISLLGSVRNNLGLWLLMLIFMILIVLSIIISRVGWNKNTKKLRLVGIIIPDIIGLLIMVVTVLYIRGVLI